MMSAIFVIICVLLVLFILWLIVYIVNETDFLYYEPKEYIETDISKITSKGANPIYHIKNNDKAIMLIHGFKGNPSDLRYFAERATKDGFDVILPIQPGAGTTTEDFKKTCFPQWYSYIKDVYTKYRPKYKYFFIAGSSMGGSLTLKLAEEFSNKKGFVPTAIASFSAPVFLNSVFENGVLYKPQLYFSRMISWFVNEIPSNYVRSEEDGANDKSGYSGIFMKQTHSLKMGLKTIKSNLSRITSPIFIAHAKSDWVVPYENMFYIARKVSSKEINTKSYDLSRFNHSHHLISVYHSSRDDLYDDTIHFFHKQL